MIFDYSQRRQLAEPRCYHCPLIVMAARLFALQNKKERKKKIGIEPKSI
jgi:hypothetical protein